MWQIMRNPPLGSYFLAAAGSLLAWGEIALHLAFLIPAIGAIVGTYYLARQLCAQPVTAALAALFTPVFLVSATNVMPDVLMVAFWIWAAALWVRGLESDDRRFLLLGALTAAASAMTKYNGASVIPLLFLYSVIRTRKIGAWAWFLFLPVVVLVAYLLVSHVRYGSTEMVHALYRHKDIGLGKPSSLSARTLYALSYTGGCLAVILFYAPLLWSRRALIIGSAAGMIALLLIPYAETIGMLPSSPTGRLTWLPATQLTIFAMTGVSVLILAAADVVSRRDAGSLLLAAWVIGIFVFAGYVSWSASGRYILPMVPAAGILLARRMEDRQRAVKPSLWRRAAWPLIPAAVVALAVTWADYTLAKSARSAAVQIVREYGHAREKLWFQGHWGFQYYMESLGARAVDVMHLAFPPGSHIVVPQNNTNTFPMPEGTVRLSQVIDFRPCRWLSTTSASLHAGFYVDQLGPLPYAFGYVRPERYRIFSLIPQRRELVAREHFNRGANLDEEGRIDEAIREYRKAIDLKPGYAEAHCNLGTALKAQGKTEEAIREYRLAAALKPNLAEAHNNLAVEMYYEGRYAEAWKEVELTRKCGVEPNPDFVKALSQKMSGDE
jgi:tetratricopeptide (TPR) repeat protein